jgi:hypothetical protein
MVRLLSVPGFCLLGRPLASVGLGTGGPGCRRARRFVLAATMVAAGFIAPAHVSAGPSADPANVDWARASQEAVLTAAAYLTIQDSLPAGQLLTRATAARAAVRNGDTSRRSAAESVLCLSLIHI